MIRFLLAAFVAAVSVAPAQARLVQGNLGAYVEGGSYTISELALFPGETVTSFLIAATVTYNGVLTAQGIEPGVEAGFYGWVRSAMVAEYPTGDEPAGLDLNFPIIANLGYEPVTTHTEFSSLGLFHPSTSVLDTLLAGTLTFNLSSSPYLDLVVYNAEIIEARIGNVIGGNVEFLIDIRSHSEPAVPEPSTWGMMLAGFGMVGGAFRRAGKLSQALRADPTR